MHARVIPLVPLPEAAAPAQTDQAPGLVSAVLQEVGRELGNLARSPEHLQIIDLRSLPLHENSTAKLRAALGQGEVTIRIRSAAMTIIEETSYPGVWWQSQGVYDEDSDSLLDQGRLDVIVIARVPPLVGAPPEDVAEAAARLCAIAPTIVNSGDLQSTGDLHD